MLDYQSTKSALHVRAIDFDIKEYMFVLQVVMGEDPRVAYASVYDKEFERFVPSEDEEEYLSKFSVDAKLLIDHQNCKHLKEYLNQEYTSEIQSKATNLKDFKFTSSDIQKLLNNLLKDRSDSLSEASVRDIVGLIKSMYDTGALDSGDNYQSHFITIPSKYNVLCPQCNREAYAVEGLDFRCEHCGCIAKWSEEDKRFFPQPTKL